MLTGSPISIAGLSPSLDMAIAATANPTHAAVFSCGVQLAQPLRASTAIKASIRIGHLTFFSHFITGDNMGKDSKLGIQGVWIVVALLLLLVFMFWQEADAAEFEAGAGFLSGEFSEGGALIFNQRVGQFDVGGGYVSKQQCHCTNPASLDENIFFHAQRVVQWRALEAGLGAAYFQNTNRALGKSLTWSLSLGLRFDHWSIKVRHFSNAGSGSPNLGQDLLMFGYRFD